MAAPLVAAEGAQAVQPIVQGAIKVLSTDIVQAEGKFYRRVKRKQPLVDSAGRVRLTKKGRVRYKTIIDFEPVNVSAHLNPIGLSILALGVAAGAAILFGRVKVGVLGIGEIELYKGILADEFDAWRKKRTSPKDQEQTPPAQPPSTVLPPIRPIILP